jgi:uncharacterized membrane protein
MAIGPVQLLVVSFDEPNFTGRIIEELRRLRENGVIRLIDALVVQKHEDGSLTALQWSDLSVPEAQGLGATVGADGHLIDDGEVWDLSDSLPNGSAAAIALIEHLWADPLRDAIARAGGVPVSDRWVHPLDLVEVGLMRAEELEPA